MKDPSLWRPITSAPQDGTEVLVFADGHVAVATFVQGRWQAVVAGQHVQDAAGVMILGSPTHWRPLPPPPGSAELLRP